MANIDIKGVIFDYGGTIDSRGVHWSEIIYDGYRHAGLDIDKESFRKAYVWAEREMAVRQHVGPTYNFLDLMRVKIRLELSELERYGLVEAEEIESLAEKIAQYCYKAARTCVEEARPVLDAVHGRLPMVLVSNFYGNVGAVLEDFDLRKYFEEIVESAVVGVRKPDPAIFRLGVDALGLQPEQVLVVGDSFRKDIEPSLSLGCSVAWLKGKGWTAEEDAVTHPSQISRLADILPLLHL